MLVVGLGVVPSLLRSPAADRRCLEQRHIAGNPMPAATDAGYQAMGGTSEKRTRTAVPIPLSTPSTSRSVKLRTSSRPAWERGIDSSRASGPQALAPELKSITRMRSVRLLRL